MSPYHFKLVYYRSRKAGREGRGSPTVVSGTCEESLNILLVALARKHGDDFELIFFGQSAAEECRHEDKVKERRAAEKW